MTAVQFMNISKKIKSGRIATLTVAVAMSAFVFGMSTSTAYADIDSSLEQTKKVVEDIAIGEDETVKVEAPAFKTSVNELVRNISVAVGEYRKNSSKENEQALRALLNQSYDINMMNDSQRLTYYEARKGEYLERWSEDIEDGVMPTFVEVYSAIDPTSDERESVKNAVNKYWTDKTEENRIEAMETIEVYYNAFLDCLKAEIADEKEHRQENIDKAIEYFASEGNQISVVQYNK